MSVRNSQSKGERMPAVQNCQKCKGQGYHYATMKDLAGKQPHGLGITALVPCDAPACRGGKVTTESREAYYKSF